MQPKAAGVAASVVWRTCSFISVMRILNAGGRKAERIFCVFWKILGLSGLVTISSLPKTADTCTVAPLLCGKEINMRAVFMGQDQELAGSLNQVPLKYAHSLGKCLSGESDKVLLYVSWPQTMDSLRENK